MNIKRSIQRVVSVGWFKSLYVNIYYFGLRKALKFPILLGHNVILNNLGAKDALEVPMNFGSLCFALKGGPFALGDNKSYWHIGKGAKLIIKGTCRFSKGTNMKLFDNAVLEIGDGFTSNANLIVSCANHITFGADNLLGWNITIMDNDGGHPVLKDGLEVNTPKPIVFGDHVWIASECSVLKGSKVSSGAVIGYKSNVCGLICDTENAVIVGNPAKVKSDSVRWEH